MIKIVTFLSISSLFLFASFISNEKGLHQFKFKSLEGNEVNFSDFKGKKVLIVNVASKCGYTPQYGDLEKLYKTYGSKLVIVGFPANDFGSQEPGSNSEIKEFCSKNYGVSFIMMEKSAVTGKEQNEVYQWLSKETGKSPSWNFCKYLVDEKGKVVKFFPSSVKPLSKEITDLL